MTSKLLLLCTALLLSLATFSQSPQSFNYQAVARDASGNPIANQSVSFQITIHETSAQGTAVYVEVHQDMTNDFGLSTLAIGQGTVVSGVFSSIGWGTDSHFMEVEFDPAGGTNYLAMGTSELLSVPYALHAHTVEVDEVDDADADPGNELQSLSIVGDTIFISSGNFIELPSGMVDTDDQTLSLSNDSLSIADGNAVDLSVYLDDTDTDDQTLSLSNDSLLIADGNAVDLSAFLDNTDSQNLSIVNDSLLIADGSGVDLSPYLDDTDTDTDDQTLSLSNDSLTIADGNSIDLSAFLDNTDSQNLSIVNDSLLIADGNGVDLSPYLDDTDTDTDDQTLSFSGSTLSIVDGNSVSLNSLLDNTDEQTLSLSGTDLSISGGNTVSLADIQEITSIQDADNDTKIQVEESSDEDRIRFDIAGTEYFQMREGRLETSNNGISVIIGERAGVNDDQTSNENVFMGYFAGNSNVNSVAGVGIGRAAMEKHTTGSFTVAIGNYALQRHEDGSNNVAIGGYAANNNVDGNNNTALGTGAMRFDTTGNQNVAIGAFSLYNGENVGGTVALGYNAGYNSTGDNNVFLGKNAGYSETGSDKLYIDNTNTSSPLIYGEFNNNLLTVNGDLGATETGTFGTISTGNESTDQGTSNQSGNGFTTTPWLYTNAMEAQDERGTGSTLITLGNDGTYGAGDEIHMVTSGTDRVMISSSGFIGIDETAPAADIHLRQSQQSITNGTGGMLYEDSSDDTDWWRTYHSGIHFSFNRSGTRLAYIDGGSGAFTVASDARLKKNVHTLYPVLDRVMRLRPVTYHYKRQPESDRKIIGFIAQEAEELFPEMVSEGEDGYKAMSYANAGVIAIKAVQEQQTEIEALKAQVESLLKVVEQLQNQLGDEE